MTETTSRLAHLFYPDVFESRVTNSDSTVGRTKMSWEDSPNLHSSKTFQSLEFYSHPPGSVGVTIYNDYKRK